MKRVAPSKKPLANPATFSKMRGISLALAVCFGSGYAAMAVADQVKVPLKENVRQGQQQALPGKGDSKAAVESRFGQPSRQTAPVGTPPISQWHYDGFVVYFEHDHVIHSAAKRQGG